LCLLAFIFIIQQNSAKADTIIHRQYNTVDSMTDFISQKSLSLLSDNIKTAKEDYQKEFDVYSDYSLQKYISDDIPLNNKKYTPSDLVQIDSEYIVIRAGRPYLRMPAQVALEKMAEDFYLSLDRQFYLISAYRSYSDQTSLFED
jgi:LAS superfamily LD-carboxypeptidase LdcB